MEEMANKFQDKWLDQLPWVLLGKRVTLQPDVGASPSQLTMGLNVKIPGQILREPGDMPDSETLKELLHQVRVNTNNPPVPTSNHRAPEPTLPPIPEGVSYVYTKQHNATGFQVPFEGPFKVDSWPSKSTVKIEVGLFKNGEKRFEIRHVNDLKLAHPESLAAPAVRPKLGRPAAVTSSDDVKNPTEATPSIKTTPSNRFPDPPKATNAGNKQASTGRAVAQQRANSAAPTHETSILVDRQPASERPTRSTRNPNPYYVDSIAVNTDTKAWSATKDQLKLLNHMINSR